MGSQWSGRTREAERVAGQAWEDLVAAVESGGQGAKSLAQRTAGLADGAGDRLGSVVDESRRRAGAALDALAGRRSPVQWEWILSAAVAGAVVGWLAARMTRRAAEEAFILEETDPVVADESKGFS